MFVCVCVCMCARAAGACKHWHLKPKNTPTKNKQPFPFHITFKKNVRRGSRALSFRVRVVLMTVNVRVLCWYIYKTQARICDPRTQNTQA
jgi:hypothetical protein